MSVKVQTLNLAKFQMPEVCVVCGSPPLPGAKWKVSDSKTEQKWSSTEYHTLNLEFPLCPDGKKASQKKFLGRLVYVFR